MDGHVQIGFTVGNDRIAFAEKINGAVVGIEGHAAGMEDANGGTRSGAAFGGGLILELALTTRLALTARADYTSAHVAPDGGWAGTEMFTAGIAIY